RHRAKLAGLFSSLREAVLSQADASASKCQVLRKAKSCIQELEQTLGSLLKMKESFSLEDGSPSSLEEVREEYVKRHFSNHSTLSVLLNYQAEACSEGKMKTFHLDLKSLVGKNGLGLHSDYARDLINPVESYFVFCFLVFSSVSSSASPLETVSESSSTVWCLSEEYEKNTTEDDVNVGVIQSPPTSSPDLLEFEQYLCFYKHTVDLLIEHGVVCTEEVLLPVVSTAISHLWQELSEESRECILQYCRQRAFLLDPKVPCQEPACAEGSQRDSRGNSEEASGSLVSTQEEVMFEDAFDVASGFLDRNETQGMSSQSSAFGSCTSENPEDHHRLYLQIIDFLKSLFFANTQFCQEEALPFDYETVMLRCTETFDDE
ncbi:Stimulated by retinoic acid 8, partial [Tinamus guttatus]